MSTADAMRRLRENLGVSQKGLAEVLQSSVRSVSRYENGEEPSGKFLHKLAQAAFDAKLQALCDLFLAKRKLHVDEKLKNLPTPGSAKRISDWELREILQGSSAIIRAIPEVIGAFGEQPSTEQIETLKPINTQANRIIEITYPYLGADKSSVWNTALTDINAVIGVHETPAKKKANR